MSLLQAVEQLEAELSATNEKLDAADKRIRESQEQTAYGLWHIGETADESDFFLAIETGDVSIGCESCVKLYTMPPIPPELAELQRELSALQSLYERAVEQRGIAQLENAELRKQLNEFDSIGLAICALSSNSGIENGHDGWSLHVGKLRELLNGEKP